jgi:hypothetical protein
MRSTLSILIVLVFHLNLLQPVLSVHMGVDLSSFYSRFSGMAEEKEEEPHSVKSLSDEFKSSPARVSLSPDCAPDWNFLKSFADDTVSDDHSFSIDNPPEA